MGNWPARHDLSCWLGHKTSTQWQLREQSCVALKALRTLVYSWQLWGHMFTADSSEDSHVYQSENTYVQLTALRTVLCATECFKDTCVQMTTLRTVLYNIECFDGTLCTSDTSEDCLVYHWKRWGHSVYSWQLWGQSYINWIVWEHLCATGSSEDSLVYHWMLWGHFV